MIASHLLSTRMLRHAWSYALLAMLSLSLCLAPGVVRQAQAAPAAAPAAAHTDAPPTPGAPRVYWVNDPGDAPDATPGNGTCDTAAGAWPAPPAGTGRARCTLRAAITEANADAGHSVIAFEICPIDIGPDGLGAYSVVPAQPLPSLTAGLTYINGYTQGYPQATPGYDDPAVVAAGVCQSTTPPLPPYRTAVPNTASFGSPMNTVLAIGIDGMACTPPGVTGSQTTNVPGGVVPSGSILNWGSGRACSGLTVTSDKNVIAGLNIRNWENAGILIMPLTSVVLDKPNDNVVWGDFIGTDIRGYDPEGNRFGVEIIGESSSNFVGETIGIKAWGFANQGWVEEHTNAERNLISGNDNPSNVYGAACDTTYGFYNDGAGVFMGVDPCIRVSNSNDDFVFVKGALDNHVRNSYIGTTITGTVESPNSNGVWLAYDAGGQTAGVGQGVKPGNHIGGCVVFPFTAGAVYTPTIYPPPGVGGGEHYPDNECYPQFVDHEQDPNLISGNGRRVSSAQVGGHGVWILGSPTPDYITNDGDVDWNEIAGNFIGTDASGLHRLPNRGDGVYLQGTLLGSVEGPINNEIGAATEFMPSWFGDPLWPFTWIDYRYGNLISGNGSEVDSDDSPGHDYDNGVEIWGGRANSNRVAYGNLIGLDATGNGALGNGDNGVLIWDQAHDNYTHNNSGNNISEPYSLYDARGYITATLAGGISANGSFASATGRNGVYISASGQRNHVFRNCIGSDAIDCLRTPAETENLGNLGSGVLLDSHARFTLIGLHPAPDPPTSTLDQPNWIHHNGRTGVSVGVSLTDNTATQNTIRFNSIWMNGNPNWQIYGRGIDLGDDDVTLNDAGDVDTGPNHLQNFPYGPGADINAPPAGVVSFTVQYQTDCAPLNDCTAGTVDFYVSLLSESDYNAPSGPPPSNHGEGRHWLAATTVYTTAVQTEDLSAEILNVYGGLPPEDVCITLTTTNQFNSTSEFTKCARFHTTAIDVAGGKVTLPWADGALVIGAAGLVALGVGAFVIRRRRMA